MQGNHVRTYHTCSTCYSNVQWSSHRPILQTYNQLVASRLHSKDTEHVKPHVRHIGPRWERSPCSRQSNGRSQNQSSKPMVRHMNANKARQNPKLAKHTSDMHSTTQPDKATLFGCFVCSCPMLQLSKGIPPRCIKTITHCPSLCARRHI